MKKTWKQIGSDFVMETKYQEINGKTQQIIFPNDPKDTSRSFFLRLFEESKNNKKEFFAAILDGFFLVKEAGKEEVKETYIGPADSTEDLLEMLSLLFDIETAEVVSANFLSQLNNEEEETENMISFETVIIDDEEDLMANFEKIVLEQELKKEEAVDFKNQTLANYKATVEKVNKSCCSPNEKTTTPSATTTPTQSKTGGTNSSIYHYGGYDYRSYYNAGSSYTYSSPTIKTPKTIKEIKLPLSTTSLKFEELKKFVDEAKQLIEAVENKTDDEPKVDIQFDDSNRSFPTITMSVGIYTKPTTTTTTTQNTNPNNKAVGAEEIAAKSGKFRDDVPTKYFLD